MDIIDTKYYKKDDTYYRVDIVPDDIGDIYSYDEGLNLHFYDARERSLLERYPDTLGELIEECRGTFNEEALQAFAEELADNEGCDSVEAMIYPDGNGDETVTLDDIIDYISSVDPEDLDDCPSFYKLFTPDMPVRYVEPAGYYEGGGLEYSRGSDYDGHVYILSSETSDVPDDRFKEFVEDQKKELKEYCNGEVYGIIVEGSDGTDESEYGILGSDELDEIIADYIGEDSVEVNKKEYLNATSGDSENIKESRMNMREGHYKTDSTKFAPAGLKDICDWLNDNMYSMMCVLSPEENTVEAIITASTTSGSAESLLADKFKEAVKACRVEGIDSFDIEKILDIGYGFKFKLTVNFNSKMTESLSARKQIAIERSASLAAEITGLIIDTVIQDAAENDTFKQMVHSRLVCLKGYWKKFIYSLSSKKGPLYASVVERVKGAIASSVQHEGRFDASLSDEKLIQSIADAIKDRVEFIIDFDEAEKAFGPNWLRDIVEQEIGAVKSVERSVITTHDKQFMRKSESWHRKNF
jgi:hypothetical protein